MDDFTVSSLHESKNEWGSRLLTILTPHMIDGLKSIFDEAVKLCRENNEMDKYLMTFQNFITRIPKWNSSIIELEKIRIVEKSGCGYLEDLVTCVHIIQLKLLSAIRVGQKQKKIDIAIPKLDDFLHKIYIHIARKIYKNVYLFELSIPPLQVQKHQRELEIIVQECILNTVRDSIPVEAILHAYMDETVEEHVTEEIKEEVIHDGVEKKEHISEGERERERDREREKEREREGQSDRQSEAIKQLESDVLPLISLEEDNTMAFPELTEESSTSLSFNDTDFVRDENNQEQTIIAPKSLDRLEEISVMRNAQRKKEEEEEEEDNVKLKIFDQDVALDHVDIHTIDLPEMRLEPDLLLHDVEVLA